MPRRQARRPAGGFFLQASPDRTKALNLSIAGLRLARIFANLGSALTFRPAHQYVLVRPCVRFAINRGGRRENRLFRAPTPSDVPECPKMSHSKKMLMVHGRDLVSRNVYFRFTEEDA